MYGLSVGIARVGDTLPAPVYALLSGLNAATIGIIALAAVNLAGRAITDELTRILVFLGGALGMLYTALWYYPVVMVGAGLTTMGWDLRWSHTLVEYAVVRPWRRIRMKRNKKNKTFDAEKGYESWPRRTSVIQANIPSSEKPLPAAPRNSEISNLTETDARYLHPRQVPVPAPVPISKFAIMPRPQPSQQQNPQQKPTPFPTLIPLRTGSLILTLFALSFLALLLLRALLHHQEAKASRPFALFSSLYLAGTIIFGGGPVVIPLLRSYLVAPGWVSPRDFLLGLAIIQAFPGPNFNFAVYLGALAAKGCFPPAAGAVLAFLAIFAPGMVVLLGFLGVWGKLEGRRWFGGALRGVNAAAVGLIFTAVYKLWEIGLVGPPGGGSGGGGHADAATGGAGGGGGGMPLGGDPWLVAVTAAAFVGGRWFGVSAPVAILCGGLAGVGRWGVFER